jgi:type I restriction enzyme M protein
MRNQSTNQRVSSLVQKVWSYAHVLRDEGLGYLEYTEQITYLLFLKLASQRGGPVTDIPTRYGWDNLLSISDNLQLKKRYEQALQNLSRKPGILGIIFAKPQSKIEDPAKLRHLMNMIDEVEWASLDVDIKGAVYESLLARNSDDIRSGAGQYFTPRPIVRAVIEVLRPEPGMVISDPASGTGGFLLAAYERLRSLVRSPREERFLRTRALVGTDIVSNVARLCMMNLYLHGVGIDPRRPPIKIEDSLASPPTTKVDMVATNPPFGKKSSITIVSGAPGIKRENLTYARSDLWATTSNKQLNFVQHVYAMLKDNGRAAIVVPDNVLFEGGAGEKIRRQLLKSADVHTLVRLPTGIWYSTGVKANVLFFDKKCSLDNKLWVYDLRTNKNFTLRNNPILSKHLDDFIECYNPDDRSKRVETDRFKSFSHESILASERANLDLIWLTDDLYKERTSLPSHEELAAEVIDLLKEAMSEFETAVGWSHKRKNVRRKRGRQ